MRRLGMFVCILIALAPSAVSSPAAAKSAPDKGIVFEPRPRSVALYGTQSPDADPDRQRHYVEAHDGVDLYVETWLPAPKGGNDPPAKVPTILVMTPYVVQGQEEYPASGERPSFIEYMTARGYAVAQHHVRGTGESGGCLEQTAKNQIDDGARVIEYLGGDAPWSNGKVGMYGASYDAETQISTAGLGDPKRTKYLKAIVPTASVGSQYDWNFMDGVNWVGQPLIGNTAYLAGVSLFPGQEPAPQHYPEKLECQDEVMGNSANFTGDYTEYWREREYRPGAHKVRAATLFVHGLRDFNVQPITIAGFFDRLSKNTPHKGLFGVWNHAFPDSHASVEPEWARSDWLDMVTAWFDRYLKGLPTGVTRWPAVQVQSSTGQWWVAPEFTRRLGRPGQLALTRRGRLGARKPKGVTSYVEQLQPDQAAAAQQAVFETRKLKRRLHITGQPVLDLWLKTDRPDGHVAATIEVIGRDGEVLRHEGSRQERFATYGVRSLQHLDPMRRGWFEQESGDEPPTNEPIRVAVRFLPTDLVAPRGGKVRVTVSGSVSYSKGDSQPSGSASTITVLHNCANPSMLRFVMPPRRAHLLNVREIDEREGTPLASKPRRVGRRDGGRAARNVCGKRPIRPERSWRR